MYMCQYSCSLTHDVAVRSILTVSDVTAVCDVMLLLLDLGVHGLWLVSLQLLLLLLVLLLLRLRRRA